MLVLVYDPEDNTTATNKTIIKSRYLAFFMHDKI